MLHFLMPSNLSYFSYLLCYTNGKKERFQNSRAKKWTPLSLRVHFFRPAVCLVSGVLNLVHQSRAKERFGALIVGLGRCFGHIEYLANL